MSFLYDWKVSNGDKVLVEYCFSSVDKCIKVVEMSVNGKYHRESWMSTKGKAKLHTLLEADYNEKVGISV
tara:strand:- start:77 stop:286 length:210 start_codon:yes stop_codon:yes gene_type:complete